MTREGARAVAAIKSLDLPGVLSLMKNIEEMRKAATENLEARAEDDRRAKKAKRAAR
jgi:hypothetical protein